MMELICKTRAKKIKIRRMPKAKRYKIYFGADFELIVDEKQAKKIHSELDCYFGD